MKSKGSQTRGRRRVDAWFGSASTDSGRHAESAQTVDKTKIALESAKTRSCFLECMTTNKFSAMKC
jgi:hypothetical protein